jgi:O-antigen/teichoic acid export membrane protein
LFLASDWLAQSIFHKPSLGTVFRLLGPAIPLVVMLRILAASTSVTRRLQYLVLAEEIAQPLLQVTAFVVLFCAQVPGIDAAMVAVLLSLLLAVGAAGAFASRLFGSVGHASSARPEPLGEMLSFSIPVALGGFLGSFLLWADRLLVGALGTESDAGIYAIVSLVSVVFVTLLSGFKSSLAPMAAALQAPGERAQLSEAFRLSTRWSQYLAIPIFLFLVSSGGELLVWALGPAYQAGRAPLLILCIGQLINACTGPADTLLIMGGHPRRWTMLAGLGLAGLVLLAWLWIPHWGLLGAALASAVTVALVSLGGLAVVYVSMRLSPFDRRTVRVLAAGLVTLAALLVLGRVPIPWTVVRLSVNAAVSLGLFLAVMAVGGMPPEDLTTARALWGKVRGGWSRLWRARAGVNTVGDSQSGGKDAGSA